jgi:hypothetical protein
VFCHCVIVSTFAVLATSPLLSVTLVLAAQDTLDDAIV